MKHVSLIATAALLLTACQTEQSYQDDGQIEVSTITVTAQALDKTQRYPAQTDAAAMTELAFQIGGELKQLPVKAGDRVKQGQLLAKLDTRNLEFSVSDQQAKYDLSQRQYQRAEALASKGAMSASQHDQLESQLDVTKAALRMAKHQLSYGELRAPFDGIIARVVPKNYEKVDKDATVIVMHRSDTVELKVQIPEAIMASIHPEQVSPDDFRIYFDQAPGTPFSAVYKEHTTELDPTTGSYVVTLEMPMPSEFKLLQGMPAWVEGDVKALTDTLVPIIPTQALVSAEDEAVTDNLYSVWVVDENQQVERVPVTLGELRHNGVQIISGLSAGQQVVVGGQYQLSPGITVTVVDGEE